MEQDVFDCLLNVHLLEFEEEYSKYLDELFQFHQIKLQNKVYDVQHLLIDLHHHSLHNQEVIQLILKQQIFP